MPMRRILTFAALGAAILAAVPGAALADTARASDRISIFEQPHNQANEVIGMLMPGQPVDIDRCTASGKWCRVVTRAVTGWVPAAYLVGAAAKIDATPQLSLTSPPVSQQNDLGHMKQGNWW